MRRNPPRRRPHPGTRRSPSCCWLGPGDDNTALLFEDQRWSWRELVQEAATRSALMQWLRPQEQPWHVGVLLLFTSGSTGAPKAVICSTGRWAYICQVNPIRFTCDDVAYNAMPIFPVPDPVTGDQVMAALEFSDREFNPGAFGPFLGGQPDLGTKWVPRLLRITRNLPMTATHKVSKPALRRMLWNGEDPVYQRIGERYVLMTADRKGALEAEYVRRGRDHLLRI